MSFEWYKIRQDENAEMLYIFLMDKGSFLKLELKYKFNTVQTLMESIEQNKYGIQIHKQILLVSGGHVMCPQRIVDEYDAGDSESNPIYVFNHDCSNPTYQLCPVTFDIQDDDVVSRIQQLQELRISQHAVHERARLLSHLKPFILELQNGVTTLIQEQHAMVQGWGVVLANVDEIATTFKARIQGQLRRVEMRVLQRLTWWQECFQRLAVCTPLLERIPLLPALTTSPSPVKEEELSDLEALQMGSSHFPDTETRNGGIPGNLYDWILQRCQCLAAKTDRKSSLPVSSRPVPQQPALGFPTARRGSLPHMSNITQKLSPMPMLASTDSPGFALKRPPHFDITSALITGNQTKNWLEESREALKTVKSNPPHRVMATCEQLIQLGTCKTTNRRLEFEQFTDWLQNLSPYPQQAQALVAKVDTIHEVLQRDASRLGAPDASSKVTMSILQEMCQNHVELLVHVRECYEQMMHLVQRCNHSKCELAHLLFLNQQWMARYQQDVCRQVQRVKLLSASCHVLERFSLVVHQMESAPRLYARCLREIVRQRELRLRLETMAVRVLGVHPTMEASQRASLSLELKNHFLQGIFSKILDSELAVHGLEMLTQADRPMLPEVTRGDLQWISGLVPELREELDLPPVAEEGDRRQLDYHRELISMAPSNENKKIESREVACQTSGMNSEISPYSEHSQYRSALTSPTPMMGRHLIVSTSDASPFFTQGDGFLRFEVEAPHGHPVTSSATAPVPFWRYAQSGRQTLITTSTTSSQFNGPEEMMEKDIFDLECTTLRLPSDSRGTSEASTQTKDRFVSSQSPHLLRQAITSLLRLKSIHQDTRTSMIEEFQQFQIQVTQLADQMKKQSHESASTAGIATQTEVEWSSLLRDFTEKEATIRNLREENSKLAEEMLLSIRMPPEEKPRSSSFSTGDSLEQLRAQHNGILSQLKQSMEAARVEALAEQARTLHEDWLKERAVLHQQFDVKIRERELELQGTIDSLAEKNMDLLRQMCDLQTQRMKDRDLIRRLKMTESGTASPLSSSPSVRGEGESAIQAALPWDIPAMPSCGNNDATLSNSANRLVSRRVLKFVHHNFKTEDVVAFVPVSCQSGVHWRMLSSDGELYFLHSTCYDVLLKSTTFMTSIEDKQQFNETKLSCWRNLLYLAVFLSKERLLSTKAGNRFDLPLNQEFFFVKIRPRQALDTAKC